MAGSSFAEPASYRMPAGLDMLPAPAASATRPVASADHTALPPLLIISADPFQVLPGGVISYSVTISNVASEALLSVVLSDTLPAGADYVAQSAVGFSYSPAERRLTWRLEQLEADGAARGGFQVRASGLGIGALITNTIGASSAATPVVMTSAVVEVAPPRQNRVWATPDEGGWLRSEDGRVDLRAPPEAVRTSVEVRYAPWTGLPLVPQHMLFAFTLEATDENGQAVQQFERSLTLSSFLHPQQAPAGTLERLVLFRYDEASATWQAMPSRVDHAWRRVIALVEQLGLYGVGVLDVPSEG